MQNNELMKDELKKPEETLVESAEMTQPLKRRRKSIREQLHISNFLMLTVAYVFCANQEKA